MKLFLARAKDWVWAWWTAPQRLKLMSAAYFAQGRRLRGAEEALARVAQSLEQDAANADLPGLTAAQIERLACTAEECGELTQAMGKVLRHGWQSASPFGGPPNQVAAEREAGDLLASIDRMMDAGDLRRKEVHAWRRKKACTGRKWMHHQPYGNGGKEREHGSAS